MSEIYLTYINGKDIAKLAMTDAEILEAVERALIAQGKGETVIEPRVHLIPDPAFNGHFNVLRGYVAPLGLAGVKIVDGQSRLLQIVATAMTPGGTAEHVRQISLGYSAATEKCDGTQKHSPYRQLASIQESAWHVALRRSREMTRVRS